MLQKKGQIFLFGVVEPLASLMPTDRRSPSTFKEEIVQPVQGLKHCNQASAHGMTEDSVQKSQRESFRTFAAVGRRS